MKVIADFTIIPLGVGVSLSKYVAVCEKIFTEMGVEHHLHANGTNLEGEWDQVMEALKRCHEELHAMGVPRISTVAKLGTRTDKPQTMADKVGSVEDKLSQM